MIVATHQPIFLPWPGFFFKASRADTLVLLDQVQFPLGRGWLTRNRLKCDKGELWLRVPVWKRGRGKQFIRAVELCQETDWQRKHLMSLRQQYAHAPYVDDYLPNIESAYERTHQRLIDLNVDLIDCLWDALGLRSKKVLQSELGITGSGTDLLVSVCRALSTDTYLSFQPVEKYLDIDKFSSNGIELDFARFHPPVYPQLWGDFRYNLSTLDLILNCGPRSLDIIVGAGLPNIAGSNLQNSQM